MVLWNAVALERIDNVFYGLVLLDERINLVGLCRGRVNTIMFPNISQL